MKRVLLTGLVLFLGLTVITSCGKDDDDDPVATIKEQLIGSMSADLDGVSWSADAPGAVRTNGTIVLTGITTDQSKTIILTANGTTTGTYNFTLPNLGGGALIRIATSTDTTEYAATSGSMDISSLNTTNTRLSGTFSFSGLSISLPLDTIDVTSGTFTNVLYTDQ